MCAIVSYIDPNLILVSLIKIGGCQLRKSTHSQVAYDCQPESGYIQQISLSCSKTKASQFFEIVMSRGPLLFAPFAFSVLLSLTVEVTPLRSSSDL